jgi:flagellar assembly protein FliH
MSLSDSKKASTFTASNWGVGNASGNDKQESHAAKDGEGFKTLYSNAEKQGMDGFVASFISEEKARAIEKNKNKYSANPSKTIGPEELERQVYEDAFEKGQQAGLEEGSRQSREIIERLEGIANQIESAWKSLIETHESRIIELVARAVEKVVYGQVALDQEMVKRAIIEALRVVPEPVNVQISVNPEDYEYIETVKEDFFSHIKALKDVSVTPDPSIHQGGCNVRTRFGEVDATLESRLEAIRECLLGANGKKTGI